MSTAFVIICVFKVSEYEIKTVRKSVLYHSFSTFAKLSKKLAFLTPFYVCLSEGKKCYDDRLGHKMRALNKMALMLKKEEIHDGLRSIGSRLLIDILGLKKGKIKILWKRNKTKLNKTTQDM